VVDASVAVKWVLPASANHDEPDTNFALDVLAGVRSGQFALLQPPHWLAEVAAVLARVSPEAAEDGVAGLYALELPVLDSPSVYLTACELARSLGQHVFDTLYHAVALETDDATLMTADERYFRRAATLGSISLLRASPSAN
jgi:predicted nucleic acid-binding protein